MEAIEKFTLGSPIDNGFTMPGEWDPHERCWMAWPDWVDQWRGEDRLDAVQQSHADVAKAIVMFEPVTMVANKESIASARKYCDRDIDIITMPIDDAWMRDSGPSFRRHAGGAVAGVAWRFNAWGGKFEYGRNAQLAGRILGLADVPVYHSSLCLEGGGVCSDGEGTVITTESVVLNPNRNHGLPKAEAEAELCRALGARKVIWLPGDPDNLTNDITDGHIDALVCFVKPGVVLFESDPSATGVVAELAQQNLEALKSARDAKGRKLEIIPLEYAYEVETDGELFAGCFVNFYIANGGVVVPKFGVSGDERAREIIARAFPERKIVQVDATNIAPGGGGIRCITQQQPASQL